MAPLFSLASGTPTPNPPLVISTVNAVSYFSLYIIEQLKQPGLNVNICFPPFTLSRCSRRSWSRNPLTRKNIVLWTGGYLKNSQLCFSHAYCVIAEVKSQWLVMI